MASPFTRGKHSVFQGESELFVPEVTALNTCQAAINGSRFDVGPKPNWTPWYWRDLAPTPRPSGCGSSTKVLCTATMYGLPEESALPYDSILFCAAPKVGSSALRASANNANDALTIKEASTFCVRAKTLRALLVRDPLTRFVSWYNDKIVRGNPGPAYYNDVVLRNSSLGKTRMPISAYAHALANSRQHGSAWFQEPHLRPQARPAFARAALRYRRAARVIALTLTALEKLANLSSGRLNQLQHKHVEFLEQQRQSLGVQQQPLITARSCSMTLIARRGESSLSTKSIMIGLLAWRRADVQQSNRQAIRHCACRWSCCRSGRCRRCIIATATASTQAVFIAASRHLPTSASTMGSEQHDQRQS